MTYEQLLDRKPYDMEQKEKEDWYCQYFSMLTKFHKKSCPAYKNFIENLGARDEFSSVEQIPMMPIGAFKQMELRSVPKERIIKTITSSGTTGQSVSRIYLDEKTANNQQKTLYRIMESFIGGKRIPMLILDSPEVLRDKTMFSARGAGILGFSILSSKRMYAFDEHMELNIDGIMEFLKMHKEKPILVFGFTYLIWEYFYKALKKKNLTLPLEHGIMVHGGGWKKLEALAVGKEALKEGIREVSGIEKVHNYYGMAEQTGCIYMECECGHLHTSIYSDILIRNMEDFSLSKIGEEGVIQVLSPMAESYPGHSILTEDQGILLGVDDCPCGRKGKYFKITQRIKNTEVRGCSDTYGG